MKFKATIILFSIAVTLIACGKKEEKGHEVMKGPAVQVSIAKVEKGDITQFSESVGTVKAAREATVASKVMGPVVRLNFKDGDRMKDGAVLLEIDDRDITAQLEQAQAGVAEASAAYKNADMNFQRMQRLLEQKSATQQQLDNAVAQNDMAKAKVQQAHANVEALKVMIGYTKVAAPFSGVITEKSIEKGEMASPGRPLFKITDDSALRLETEVKEADIKGIKTGNKIDVRIDALDRVLKGNVSKIIPSGDSATHSFMVKIDLPKAEGLLSGMFGRAYLQKGVSAAVLIPKSALIDKGQLTGVFIVKDNAAGFRVVRAGYSSGDKVEVLSGLSEGEMVAVSNLEKLGDGSAVEIVK